MPDEQGRLKDLLSYQILDTEQEYAFDDLVDFASNILGFPFVFINLIDSDRQWPLAGSGLPREAAQCPRNDSLCNFVVKHHEALIIPDAQADDRYSSVAVVCNEPHVRFYAGAPLINKNGHALGSLCVVDFEPREFPYEKVENLKSISRQVVAQMELRKQLIETQELKEQLKNHLGSLEEEKNTSERFLKNLLPGNLSQQWLKNGSIEPLYYDEVTIGFTDFVNFTNNSLQGDPADLIHRLNEYFSSFDAICDLLGVEKLKTIGDSFMFGCGIPERSRHHATLSCLTALLFQKQVGELNNIQEQIGRSPWPMRIGIHSGPLMAGIVGKSKFSYDVWGDTVNIASRFEQNSEEKRINISEATHYRIKEFFDCTPRGSIDIKGKGSTKMFWLDRIKQEYSGDKDGLVANERLFKVLSFQ